MTAESSTTIQVQYRIAPVAGIDTSAVTLSTERKLHTPIPSGHSSNHYQGLSLAVTQAQQSLNDALTVWKDAVGDTERVRESVEKGRRQPLNGSEQASEVIGSSEDEGEVEE